MAYVREWVLALPLDAIILHGCCVGTEAEIVEVAHARQMWIVGIIPAVTDCVDEISIALCDEVIRAPPVAGDQTAQYRYCYQLMIASCDELHAFWSGNPRTGTAIAVNTARRYGKPVHIHRTERP